MDAAALAREIDAYFNEMRPESPEMAMLIEQQRQEAHDKLRSEVTSQARAFAHPPEQVFQHDDDPIRRIY